MRKIFIILAAMGCWMGVQAQEIREGEPSMVYYMPKNDLRVRISYNVTTYKAGPYKEFAKELLGIEDAIQRDEVRYELTKATIRTTTAPDFSRPIVVTATANYPFQLLRITKKGLLAGYNCVPQKEEKEPAVSKNEKQELNSYYKLQPKASIPEEVVKASTKREKAVLLAKQIYRLRETRIYLLSGEVENMPADGEAMKEVLRQLESEEQGLIELFVGTKETKHKSHSFPYEPTESRTDTICRFSETDGLIDKEDEVGEPVVLTAQITRQEIVERESQKTQEGKADKKKGGEDTVQASPILYNLPGWLDYKIVYGFKCLSKQTLPIAQFGVSVPLARNLFSGNPLPHIEFDTQTGNIKSIHE